VIEINCGYGFPEKYFIHMCGVGKFFFGGKGGVVFKTYRGDFGIRMTLDSN
jgi:hypothetical protein